MRKILFSFLSVHNFLRLSCNIFFAAPKLNSRTLKKLKKKQKKFDGLRFFQAPCILLMQMHESIAASLKRSEDAAIKSVDKLKMRQEELNDRIKDVEDEANIFDDLAGMLTTLGQVNRLCITKEDSLKILTS
jgi:hypothetical protein